MPAEQTQPAPDALPGEDTRREIAYARSRGIPVSYLEPQDDGRVPADR